MTLSVTPQDFYLISAWRIKEKGPFWEFQEDSPVFVWDGSANRLYWNQANKALRLKCFWLALGSPITHLLCAKYNLITRFIKIISLHHFWRRNPHRQGYCFNHRILDLLADMARVAATIPTIISLEVAAIYGIFRPKDGRKLYATLERALYEGAILAPSFQPVD